VVDVGNMSEYKSWANYGSGETFLERSAAEYKAAQRKIYILATAAVIGLGALGTAAYKSHKTNHIERPAATAVADTVAADTIDKLVK
jgi:hypothetical protein